MKLNKTKQLILLIINYISNLDKHGIVVAGAVEDGELALPELVGLGKVLVELRDVQQVRVQPGQGVGYVSVSQSWEVSRNSVN